MIRRIATRYIPLVGTLVFALIIGIATGCKSVRTDQQIASDVQGKIQGEQALSGQNIQVSVNNGVATLSGLVSDEASRALAGNDSSAVLGVKTVVNNLVVQPPQQAAVPPQQPAPSPVPPPEPAKRTHTEHKAKEQPSTPPSPPQVAQIPALVPAPPQQAPPPPPQTPPAPQQAPPPPPKPVVKEVTLPAGTILPVRVTETLNSKTAQPNDVFHGSIAGDIGTQGVVVIHHNAPVLGRISDAREAAHFKGSALLSLELTQVTAQGQKIDLVTQLYSKEGSARGKNTVEKAGGGAALGAIIGAIADGGKGAAIGSVAGAGAGTGINAATRGQEVVIPSETLINFQLQVPITLSVTIPPNGSGQPDNQQEPQLQRR